MRIRYEMRAYQTPGRPDQVEVVSFDVVGIADPVPLLDEVENPPMTVEEIGKCTSADELRACWLKVQELPLSKVERTAMEAAVRARAETLNLNWSFEPYDGGTMMKCAEALQDSFGRPALVAILDDTPGKPLRVRFKATEADVVSLNERVYLREILADAVARAAARIGSGQATFGEYGHPPMDVTDQHGRKRFRRTRSRAVLMPEGLNMQGNEVFLDARILEDTEPGKQTAADLRAGRPVFVSTRAYGGDLRVVPLKDGRRVGVPLQMELETWDRVDNPAFPDAAPVGILDSVELQAICDAVQVPTRAPAAPAPTITHKGEGTVKWNLALVNALKGTKEGRAQILAALTDATVTLESDVRTAMTDALADVQAPAPAPAPQIDVQKAVTDALAAKEEADRQKAEAARQAREEAKTYVTTEIKAMRDGNRFPAPLIDSIQAALADAPDKATAEAQLKAQVAMADSVMPAAHLVRLGYGAAPGQAAALHVQVRDNQNWKPIYDSILKELDDYRSSIPGESRPDLKLREVNKPFVDKLLHKFDIAHAAALVDASMAWQKLTDSATTTTADVWTQVIVQRAILEQVFGDADMLQFLGTDVFQGTTMTQMVEYYEASGSPGHHTGEMQPIARGKVKTAYIAFSALPRRIATEISNDVQQALQSGPLNYNTAARSLYHTMAELRRVLNIEAGDEMLRASDAYGASAVANEKVLAAACETVNDAGNAKYKITLVKGNNAEAPVVRPRAYDSFSARGQATKIAENPITVKIGTDVIPMRYLRTTGAGVVEIVDEEGVLAEGFAVDFENGIVYISDGLDVTTTEGQEDTLVSYSYATNYSTFDLTVPNGVTRDEHYNSLLWAVDDAHALMGRHPRYRPCNLVLGSLSAMNPVTQASLFYKDKSPNGTVLSPTSNFIANRNGCDYARHNTQWQAGDRRILLGTARATKFAVRDVLKQKGPYPIYSAAGRILPGEQWYVEGFDALITPEIVTQDGTILNPYYHSIVFKTS